uniref:Synembryn n=1 Tax=Sphaeramia orbicularis TaxID=375764 RepID=A0A672YW37_9TELE
MVTTSLDTASLTVFGPNRMTSVFYYFSVSVVLSLYRYRFQRLTEALLSFINNQLQPPVLRTCLHTLRILSRDRRALGPLVTDNALLTFANLGGISISQTYPQQEEERNEDDLETSNGPVCGIIGEEDVLTSVTVSSRSSAEDPGFNSYMFYSKFCISAEHGVSVLTKVLEQCLGVRSADNCYRNLPISKDMSQQVIEILKILFNVVHRHTVNVLSALPLACLDILLAVPVNQASHECDGVNMDCVHALVLFMERRLNRSSMLKEKLTPVLNLLTESSRVHRETRHYLRQKILPPLRDVDVRPEHDTALRGQLVRLMTHVDTDVKYCAAELLFVLCKENVSRFVKYTGYGNAAGLLAARGLLNGRWNSTEYSTQYSSDSDSDTEEYKEARNRINLVTGRVEEEQPDPMEGLTDEEKEAEALRLIGMINRLSQCVIDEQTHTFTLSTYHILTIHIIYLRPLDTGDLTNKLYNCVK